MSSSAQIVAVGCVNAIEQMRDDGAEIKRLRARVAELEESLRECVTHLKRHHPPYLCDIITEAEALLAECGHAPEAQKPPVSVAPVPMTGGLKPPKWQKR